MAPPESPIGRSVRGLWLRSALFVALVLAFIASIAFVPAHGLVRDSQQSGQSTYRLPEWKWPFMDGAGFGYTDLTPERTDLFLEGVVMRPGKDSEAWRIRHRGAVEVWLDGEVLLREDESVLATTQEVRARWSGEFARLKIVLHPRRSDLAREPGYLFAVESRNAWGGWSLIPEHRLFAEPPSTGQLAAVATWAKVRTGSFFGMLVLGIYSLLVGLVRARREAPSAVSLAIAIFVAALISRTVLLTDRFEFDPRFWTLSSNGDNYVLFARSTLAGGPSAVRGAYYGPGNIWWIMGLTSAMGPELVKLAWTNVLLGSLSVATLGYAVARVRGVRAGALVGLIGSFYGPLIFFHTTLQVAAIATSAMAFLIASVLRHHESPAGGRAFASGLFLGAAALARPTHLILAPVLFFAFLLRKQWRDAGLLTVGTLCMVLPQTALNATSLDPSLISANGPVNLLLGNNTDASGDYSRTPAFFAARATARFNDETLTDATRAEILRDPVRAAELFVRKCALVILHDETDGMISYPKQGLKSSAFMRWATLDGRIGMGLLSWLALFGAATALLWRSLEGALGEKRRDRVAITLALCAVAFGLATAAVFVNARIRSPVIPLLITVAALGLDACLSRRIRLRAAIGSAGVATACALVGWLALTHLPTKPSLEGLPADASEVAAVPGAKLELLGYRLGPEKLVAGRFAYVTLYWRAPEALDEDLEVVVSVVGAEGGKPLSKVRKRIGSVQFPPRGTSEWVPGTILEESYFLSLRRNTPDAIRLRAAVVGNAHVRALGGLHPVGPLDPIKKRILD